MTHRCVDVAGHLTMRIGLNDLLLRALRDDPKLDFVFIDICGVDYPARERRFDVVYHFLSPTRMRAPG
jgi:NADH-quinone oxidoreductase subunit C